MPGKERPRHSASYAVAALRKAMKKTQTSFAVEVLGVAVSTVARYETSHAPSGEVLLRLASIAESQGLPRVRDVFRRRYIDEVFAKFGFRTEPISAHETIPTHGYLLVKLSDSNAMLFKEWNRRVSEGAKSRDPVEAAWTMETLYQACLTLRPEDIDVICVTDASGTQPAGNASGHSEIEIAPEVEGDTNEE